MGRVWSSVGFQLFFGKVFWQTIRRLLGKRSSITYSIKDSDGNILKDENEILSRWREYFEDLLNPVKASTRDTHEVTHLGEDVIFTAAEVAIAIKGIKSGKAAGEDEIRPEMLKALTGEGILWLTRVCQVAWKLGKTPRDWQTGVIIPIFKKGDRKQCTNYRGISLLSLPGKVYAKCLERKCREIVESKLEDGQCGFRPGRSTTDQIFTLSKSSRNLGSMAKISLHALSILKKHMTEFLGINFGRFCRSMALMVNCYALLSHSTADRRFVFG